MSTIAQPHGDIAYRISVPRFQDSDGDGFGDLEGITSRIGYLADDLGVSTLVLSPIFATHGAYSDDAGTVDYLAIEPRFGDEAGLGRLVRALHDRGMKLYLELDSTYTSNQHSLFANDRRQGRLDAENIYQWVNESEGEGLAWDDTRKQSYRYVGKPDRPMLNPECSSVTQLWAEMAECWLGRGVDGFVPRAGAELLTMPGARRRMVLPAHMGGAGLRAFIDETHVGRGTEKVLLGARHNGRETALDYSKRRLMALILMTLNAAPEIRHGDELGYSDDQLIMPWDTGNEAGFTRGVPWQSLPPDAYRNNVKLQYADPESTLSLYSHLGHLRKYSPALRYGTYHSLSTPDNDIYAYVREDEQQRFIVVANLSGHRKQISLNARAGNWVAGTHLVMGDGLAPNAGKLTLSPYEARVYESRQGARLTAL